MRRAALFVMLLVLGGLTWSVLSLDDVGAVLQVENLDATWDCAVPATCTADYLALPARAGAAALTKPLSDEELADLLALTQEPASGLPPVSDPVLADAIIDGLNAGWLLDAAGTEELLVTTREVWDEPGVNASWVLFSDPIVGTFEALLLVPDSPGPHPAVLALHGHGEDARGFHTLQFGRDYPGAGFAILMPTARVSNFDADEDLVTRELLRNGLTFMSVRIYEALLGLRYLSAHEDIEPARIALVGHSGGASAANLVARVADRVPGVALAALVSDFTDTYSGSGAKWLLDATAPGLYPWYPAVADFSVMEVPSLRLRYGFPDGPDPIFEFLADPG